MSFDWLLESLLLQFKCSQTQPLSTNFVVQFCLKTKISKILCHHFRRTARFYHFKIARRVVNILIMHPLLDSISKQEKRLLFMVASRHSSTIDVNSFSEERKIAKGVSNIYSMFDALCRFNHSCVPNIEHMIDDNNITSCFSLHPIKKGEQLYIDYTVGTTFNNAEDRMRYIQEKWGFICICEKCIKKMVCMFVYLIFRFLHFIIFLNFSFVSTFMTYKHR